MVCLWDVRMALPLATLATQFGVVWDVSMSEDGRWACAASEDGHVQVWDIPQRHMVATFTADEPLVACAISHATGLEGRVVVGGVSGQVLVLRLAQAGEKSG